MGLTDDVPLKYTVSIRAIYTTEIYSLEKYTKIARNCRLKDTVTIREIYTTVEKAEVFPRKLMLNTVLCPTKVHCDNKGKFARPSSRQKFPLLMSHYIYTN